MILFNPLINGAASNPSPSWQGARLRERHHEVPQAARLCGLPVWFRQVVSFRVQDADPKEGFVYHNAGLAGSGNSPYVDVVILRYKDANTAWTRTSDGRSEERRYLAQNWRADVTRMLNTASEPVEWYRYTAYGQPISHSIADVNCDGSVNASDTSIWDDLYAGTPNANTVWLNSDLNRDDVFPDGTDDTFYYAQYPAAGNGTGSG